MERISLRHLYKACSSILALGIAVSGHEVHGQSTAAVFSPSDAATSEQAASKCSTCGVYKKPGCSQCSCQKSHVTRAEFEALKAEVANRVVAGKNHPGSLRLPGTETDVHFYGMIRGNMLYDVSTPSSNYNYLYVFANAIPLQGSQEGNERKQVVFSARESRLGFEAFNHTPWGDISGHLELDFLGYIPDAYNPQIVTNTANARWRLAYFTLNKFLVGQAPTNFYSLREVAKSLDLAHGSGIGANRQMQVRYTDQIGSAVVWSVSAEGPETEFMNKTGVKTFTNKPGTGGTAAINRVPDFTGKIDWAPCEGMNLGTGFVLRHFHLKAPVKKSVRAYGIGFNGHITMNKQTTFMWQLMGGDGIGRYILDAAGQGAFYNDQAGTFKTQKAYGGLIALEHQWTPKLSSTIIGGTTRIQNDPYLKGLTAAQALGGVNKAMYSLHVNTIWSPFGEMLDLGAGYSYSTRRVEDGRTGTSNRVIVSASYKFGVPSHKSSHHHLPDAG